MEWIPVVLGGMGAAREPPIPVRGVFQQPIGVYPDS
jgi:hypothetical protein